MTHKTMEYRAFFRLSRVLRTTRSTCLAGIAAVALGSGAANASFFIDPNPGAVGLYFSALAGVSAFNGNVGGTGAGPLVGVTTIGAANTAGGYAYITPARGAGEDEEDENNTRRTTTYSSGQNEPREGGENSGLTLVRFTPADAGQFANFSLRGSFTKADHEEEHEEEGCEEHCSEESKRQNSVYSLTMRVQDDQNSPVQAFTFNFDDRDFGRIGIISTDGESIKWVEIESDGFSLVRDVDFSLRTVDYCGAHPGAPGCGGGGGFVPQDVPEPAPFALFGLGLAGLGLARLRAARAR